MAKRFVDITRTTERAAVVIQDGTALTLTGNVRILYDDTQPKSERDETIKRALEAINQLTA